ncbi:hypothetical protein RHS01_08408 [Rhizoctonia solani]|uniref:Protein F37C4,5 [Caenorhabditis elegans] n=1 Tax=Rhizoctonia solani TaxID=456999 RepID=A0A8H7I556_9AGAM|nr:hypothetical protein RHS01_08408 [Rhizoctonia solani]
MVSDQPTANRIIVNSAEQDDLIESVTVFQSNRAEIKRRVRLDLKSGQNHVRIERLPSCVNEDSIRVDGTGTAVIFDVVYHAPSRDQGSRATITTDLRRSLETLQKERSITQEQSEFLGNYGRTLDSKNMNIEDVQRFLDMFGPRQLAVAKRIQELDAEIGKAQKELNEAQQKEHEDVRERNAAWRSPRLLFDPVVSNASWKPLYDIRASIAKSPEDTSAIALHYRASITQTTGENWPDVALSLSTASPQLAPEPILQPMARSATALRAKAAHRSLLSGSPELTPLTAPVAMMAARAPMAIRKAHVESTGVLNTTFGIPGRSDIPSDEGATREKESVFLTCKVVNTSEFTLLRGEASVFMDDNFVSKSQIEHVSPNESFKTSLGVDSSLRVTYPAAKTLNRTATQSGFFIHSQRETIGLAQSQRITIRNSRQASVSVRVLDHVPVSTDTRIKVNILSPEGLDVSAAPTSPTSEGVDEGKRKEGPWKNAQKGVKARWAALEAGGEGTVEWSCDIAPSTRWSLNLRGRYLRLLDRDGRIFEI